MLRRSEGTRFSSPSDDEVGGIPSAIRASGASNGTARAIRHGGFRSSLTVNVSRQLLAERGPLCVGVDPHPSLLDLVGIGVRCAGLERCARGMVEALASIVPVFKPQSAFFEAYGAAGIAVLGAHLGRHQSGRCDLRCST